MEPIGVFMANGTEEGEALTVVDILRRAKLQCVTVSVEETKTIVSSHKVPIVCDELFEKQRCAAFSAAILPGGMPGTNRLQAHEGLLQCIRDLYAQKKLIGAICAAPKILGALGILQQRKATCYPGFESELQQAALLEDAVVQDGNIITSRGFGTAIPFALKIVEALADQATAKKVGNSIVFFANDKKV